MNNTTQILKKSLFAMLSTMMLSSTMAVAEKSAEKADAIVVNDLAPTKGVIRRDPSDVIKVDGTYYVYYSKWFLRTKERGPKKRALATCGRKVTMRISG